ncbi:unnamed protein product [Pleuronectes platessa]|uniref:Uncharacterized protein n=1 Tax=Pleuronectes platessa TaxID=8262 RepID=A0A9N7YZ28_PLEPL|nr:unnamed protein product [Pleuronectes platessa]
MIHRTVTSQELGVVSLQAVFLEVMNSGCIGAERRRAAVTVHRVTANLLLGVESRQKSHRDDPKVTAPSCDHSSVLRVLCLNRSLHTDTPYLPPELRSEILSKGDRVVQTSNKVRDSRVTVDLVLQRAMTNLLHRSIKAAQHWLFQH